MNRRSQYGFNIFWITYRVECSELISGSDQYNIANVKTTGYTRQEATLQAKDAINVTARYGSVGTGVTVTSIKQQRDLYYDNKYWENNSCYGRYEQKLYYMEQRAESLYIFQPDE